MVGSPEGNNGVEAEVQPSNLETSPLYEDPSPGKDLWYCSQPETQVGNISVVGMFFVSAGYTPLSNQTQ